MDTLFWQQICENDYAVPDGCDAADLTPELVSFLGSPDPTIRDTFGYTILGYWIERGVYSHDEMRGLAMQMVMNLSVGLDEPGTDSVFLRAFSALVLADIINRDNLDPFLLRNEVENLLHWTLDYLQQERDARGYVPEKGWAHTLAHAAHLLRALARSRYLTRAGLEQILTGIAEKITTPTETVYIHDEDKRFVMVVWTILQRGLVGMDFYTGWLARFALLKPSQVANGWFDPAEHAARQNTRSFLRSLYFRLILAKQSPPLRRELRVKLLATIKLLSD